MIKRIISAVLALSLLFCLCSCGKKEEKKAEKPAVVKPARVLKDRLTGLPSYVLSEDATPEEIRQMAVKAMRDELTVPWYLSEPLNYRKSRAGGDYIFRLKSTEAYGGLPYTNGHTGLLHWLQYYNFDTGEISGFSDLDFVMNMGNSCSSSVIWGWQTVCTSTSCYGTFDMVPRHGVYPVGDYKFDIALSFGSKGTDTICLENGEQTMYRSYAKVLPADALNVTYAVEDYEGCHVMMAVEPAHVEYNADGTINGDESYIYIQDQRMGALEYSEPFYVLENGVFKHYAGRTHSKFRFSTLYKSGYIPLTLAEFTGNKKYEKATVSIDKKPATFGELKSSTVSTNYSIITVNADFSQKGKTVAADKFVTGSGDIKDGKIASIDLRRLCEKESFSKLKSGSTYDLKLTALLSTGETLTVFEGSIKK